MGMTDVHPGKRLHFGAVVSMSFAPCLSGCSLLSHYLPQANADSDDGEKVVLLSWLWAQESCTRPGSINIGISNMFFPNCLSDLALRWILNSVTE